MKSEKACAADGGAPGGRKGGGRSGGRRGKGIGPSEEKLIGCVLCTVVLEKIRKKSKG